MLFDELSDGLLEVLGTAAERRPSPGCEFDIHHMEGAADRVVLAAPSPLV